MWTVAVTFYPKIKSLVVVQLFVTSLFYYLLCFFRNQIKTKLGEIFINVSYIKITTFDSFSIVLVVVEERGERVDEAADRAVVVGARLQVKSGSLKSFQLCYFIVVYRFLMNIIFFILDYQIMICVIV